MKNVAVIGRSTAGLFTALLLAAKHVPVRLFEACPQLDSSSRTLIVTPKFRELLGPLCEHAIINRIEQFEIFANGRVATFPLATPDLVVERSTLLSSLTESAERAGAQILSGRSFQGLAGNGNGLRFLVAHGSATEAERADILVAADGALSSVARSAGWPRQPTVHLMQAVVRLPKDMAQATTRVWFLPEQTPFFFWLIPHSSSQGVLGLIGKEKEQTEHSLHAFLKNKGLDPQSIQSAQIPCCRHWVHNHRRIGNSDVYLVGDAAGQVKVSTVGGLVTGLRGARAVAAAIVKGSAGREARALRVELNLHRALRAFLNRFTQDDYVRLLDAIGPSTKHSLAVINRDEALRLVARLVLNQPHILLLGLRALFTRNTGPNGSGAC